jgi:hypothetical protein
MKINCFSENKGWLFEDLKNYFKNQNILISEKPDVTADAYICIRTSEIYNSTLIHKSIVQVHGMYDYDIEFFNQALGIVFTHPMQYWLWKNRGFTGKFKILPIGSRKEIIPFDDIPLKPTIGFFCGETAKSEKQSYFFKEVVLKLKKHLDFDVLMIGRNLNHISDIGIYEDRSATTHDYSRIDVPFTSSISPGIPISVYEACAAGKPVVTTPRWFPTTEWPNVKVGSSENELVNCLLEVLTNRVNYHNRRITNRFVPYTIDNWVTENLKFLKEVYHV